MTINIGNRHGALRQLDDGDVHIWVARLDVVSAIELEQLRSTLSEDELARENKFIKPSDARAFVISRGLLRLALSEYIEVEPNRVTICYSPERKPMLDYQVKEYNGIQFNLSHSKELAIFAIGRVNAVGIDVEYIEDLPTGELAKNLFTSDEFAEFENLRNVERLKSFYRYWTRKEAYLKAQGCGLLRPLNTFSFTFSSDETPKLLTDSQVSEEEKGLWKYCHLEPSLGYVGALAIRSKRAHVKCHSIN